MLWAKVLHAQPKNSVYRAYLSNTLAHFWARIANFLHHLPSQCRTTNGKKCLVREYWG